MTLEKAIEVLNEKKYLGHDNWSIENNDEEEYATSSYEEENKFAICDYLDNFAVIAIAAKLSEVKDVEEAVSVLNKNNHLACFHWAVKGNTICSLFEFEDVDTLDYFTAIAIANQYRRE